MSEEQTPAQMREQIDALEKDLGKAKTSNADLTKQVSSLTGQLAARDAGLDPGLADLFVASNPGAEVSVDGLKAFAEKWGIGAAKAPEAPADEQKPEEAPTPNTEGLENMARAGSGSGQGGQQAAGVQTLSAQEFADLSRRDLPAAQKALSEGRVRVRDDNPYARDRVSTGDTNPFDAFNRERLNPASQS